MEAVSALIANWDVGSVFTITLLYDVIDEEEKILMNCVQTRGHLKLSIMHIIDSLFIKAALSC